MLITVMSEGELHVPRLGRLAGVAGLPAGRGDEPVRRDRHGPHLAARCTTGCAGWPSATSRRRDESDITAPARRGTDDLDPAWVDKVVELVRLTRTHPDLRVGSSVRGAIDMCAVASSLGRRARRAGRRRRRCRSTPRSSRCRAGCACARARSRTADDIVRELWGSVFATRRTTGRVTREKLAPRLGPRPPAEVPAGEHEGGRRGRRGGRQEPEADHVAP